MKLLLLPCRPMARFLHTFVCGFVLLGLVARAEIVLADDAQPPAVDSDLLVLVGSTLIEREQSHGYWEAALAVRWPRELRVRNLGWSGDTVWGDARAGFGTAQDGFAQLKAGVLGLKPTLLLVAYGANESQAGPAGLELFRRGLTEMLDAFAPTKARVVLLTPPRREDLGRPLPDPAEANRRLALYSQAIREIAAARKYDVIDLFAETERLTKEEPKLRLTDNGVHFNAAGYERTAVFIADCLNLKWPSWRVSLSAGKNEPVELRGAKIEDLQSSRDAVRFSAVDDALPDSPAPSSQKPDPSSPAAATDSPRSPPVPPSTSRVLQIAGLADGDYILRIDQRDVAVASAADWARGVALRRGPAFDQAEELRRTLLRKNELYFHRWRPQNETYLFGFRKHEQGQNAREVPLFEPLVADQEAIVRKLLSPQRRYYELARK
ncbi:MAG: SGNH/GDSL hydrolase family protein [Planctomycetia bacterium]|nr:SGNH/GDSL hydrolase family protein [Planctomycetia bacterium]